ncbi:MAG: TonB-dependent receptor [Planctomycetes bacterium]|nr:TonB-dependent receptor [Planctomycetota bacterium]
MRAHPFHRATGRFHSALGGLLVGALAAGVATALELNADRDAFTPSAHCVGTGRGLIEASHVYIDNLNGLPTNNFPELLIRQGTNEWLEWRFGVNYGIGSQGNVVTSVEVGEGTLDDNTLYESSILYGFKLATSHQDGWVPDSCFIMEGATPTYGDVFGTVPVATLVAGWEFWDDWRLDGAIRYAYSEGAVNWFSRWTPSVVLRAPVTERWEVHAEWFGSYTQGLVEDTQRPIFSPGTHYSISRNVEIGLRVGWGLTDEAAPFFSDAGIVIQY